MKHMLWLLLIALNIGYAQDINFSQQHSADSVHFNLKNNLYAPISFELIPKTEYKDVARGSGVIIQPLDSVVNIAAISKKIPMDSVKVNVLDYFTYQANFGDSLAIKHNSDYLYQFPFAPNKRIKIIQSFGGSFTHNTPSSYYAIDFNTQIGDTIYAAREGIVVKTKSEFKEHGGKEYFNKANYIMIIHDDGTLANYLHLDYQGVLVLAGDKVKRGQPIGISGFTGYSTTPHLHFVVKGANEESVPVYFKGLKGKTLKKGKYYSH